MGHQTKLQTTLNRHIAAERDLVSAVQRRRTEVPVRILAVQSRNDEVLVSARSRNRSVRVNASSGIIEARERVRYLEVQNTNSGQWVSDIRGQLGLQAVVHGTSHRTQEAQWRCKRVDSTKGASVTVGKECISIICSVRCCRVTAAATEISGRGQSAPSVSGDCRAFTDSAVNGRAVEAGATPNRIINNRDRLLGCRLVEIADVSGVILINSQQKMCLNITNVVC